MNSSLDVIAANLPAVVRRADLTRLTFGILNSKTAANLDSLNKGIPGRTRIGKYVVYPKEGVLRYLRQRTVTNKVPTLSSDGEVDAALYS